MSKPEVIDKPLSLAQHFVPPTDYLGVYGWICGYSADALFLDEATEHFTRQTRAQRAFIGKPCLALWLDPGHEALSLLDVPGVAHLAVKLREGAPFNLLHAKVALLGFRHESDPAAWKLRLLVSTGNWTQQTMEQSLDLAWRIDLSSEDIGRGDDAAQQKCADIAEAARMFAWLRPFFDERILGALANGADATRDLSSLRRFEGWLHRAAGQAGDEKPRFFHSIAASMGSQIPALVVHHAGAGARNYLALASGFFETTSDAGQVPGVLQRIVDQHKSARLLTASPELDVFVNQLACQGVGTCAVALKKAGFAVRAARAPKAVFGEDAERSLHAKFILAANCRENSHSFANAWMYLGSANLTGPGFERKSAASVGNLEAGVVFATGELYWKRVKDKRSEPLATDLLPLQWDDEYTAENVPPAGPEMAEHAGSYVATPVAWVNWHPNEQRQRLQLPEGATHGVTVLDADENSLTPDESRCVPWTGSRPREVMLQWTDDGVVHTGAVPVLDALGRLAAAELPKLGLDEAWWQLMSFPQPPDEDDLPPEDPGDLPRHLDGDGARGAAGLDAVYPIRQMMQLVENIASKQTSVAAIDWSTWCARLEQCLVQASGSPAVEAFRSMQLNPLTPLRGKAFRPTFAEAGNTPEGSQYEAVLDRVQVEWDVAGLESLGGSHE